jgi:hypothetical protein
MLPLLQPQPQKQGDVGGWALLSPNSLQVVPFSAIRCGRLLVWKSTGMSLPKHQHPRKSGLSPKLGSFHLRTGVAFWEGEMSAKPKLAFRESSCAQMTNRLKMGCSLQDPWMVGQKTLPLPFTGNSLLCPLIHQTQEGSYPSHSDHWTLKKPLISGLLIFLLSTALVLCRTCGLLASWLPVLVLLSSPSPSGCTEVEAAER